MPQHMGAGKDTDSTPSFHGEEIKPGRAGAHGESEGNQGGVPIQAHALDRALLKAPAHWNAALEEPQKAAPRSLRKSSSSTFLAPPPAQPEVLQDSSATPDKLSPDRSQKKGSKQNNANKA